MWGSGRGEPDPFRSAEWRQEEVDFAVEQNGAGKGGTLLWSGMAPGGVGAMVETWYTGRPAGLVLGGPGPFGAGLVFGAPGARSRAVFGAPGPGGRAVFGGLGFGTGRCSVGQHALCRAG